MKHNAVLLFRSSFGQLMQDNVEGPAEHLIHRVVGNGRMRAEDVAQKRERVINKDVQEWRLNSLRGAEGMACPCRKYVVPLVNDEELALLGADSAMNARGYRRVNPFCAASTPYSEDALMNTPPNPAWSRGRETFLRCLSDAQDSFRLAVAAAVRDDIRNGNTRPIVLSIEEIRAMPRHLRTFSEQQRLDEYDMLCLRAQNMREINPAWRDAPYPPEGPAFVAARNEQARNSEIRVYRRLEYIPPEQAFAMVGGYRPDRHGPWINPDWVSAIPLANE